MNHYFGFDVFHYKLQKYESLSYQNYNYDSS